MFSEVPNPDPTRPDHLPSEGLFGLPTPSDPEGGKPKPKTRTAAERGTRIPHDFGISNELREWAAEEIPGFDIDREFLKFRDYWRAQPGQKGVRKEWNAVFRNWMRRAHDERRPTINPPNSSRPEYPAGYESRSTVALADRQNGPRESAQSRKAREYAEMGAQLDAQYANGGRQ
jgi:hypothetical protein